MQEHIRAMIERAKRSDDRITVNGQQCSATSFAEEVIRLAHLATSSHMLLSAQAAASGSVLRARSTNNNAKQLPQTAHPDLQVSEQEQAS